MYTYFLLTFRRPVVSDERPQDDRYIVISSEGNEEAVENHRINGFRLSGRTMMTVEDNIPIPADTELWEK